MTLVMSATTEVSGTADACVTFFCKPNGSSSPAVQINKTFGGDTCTPTIIAREGDKICYNVTVAAIDPGTSAAARFCISSASGSVGVNTYISDDNCEGASEGTAAVPITVSVCRQNDNVVGFSRRMDGYINAPGLTGTKCVNVTVGTDVTKEGGGAACLDVYCQPGGTGSFVQVFKVLACTVPPTPPMTTQSFFIRPDDVLCYCGCAYAGAAGQSSLSYICLRSVSGFNGVVGSINSSTNKQFDCVSRSVSGCC
jgi:hypothetical protein